MTVGAMAGYHSALAIHPGTSYGIIVLMAGHYPDAAKLAYDAFALMQPAIDNALADMATTLYAGSWHAYSDNHSKPSSARVIVEKGTLYMESYTLLGVDALSRFGAQGRLALRPSGRRDEFRCVMLTLRMFPSADRASFTASIRAYLAIMDRSTWAATRIGTGRTCGAFATMPPLMRSTLGETEKSDVCMSRHSGLSCREPEDVLCYGRTEGSKRPYHDLRVFERNRIDVTHSSLLRYLQNDSTSNARSRCMTFMGRSSHRSFSPRWRDISVLGNRAGVGAAADARGSGTDQVIYDHSAPPLSGIWVSVYPGRRDDALAQIIYKNHLEEHCKQRNLSI